MNFIEIISYLVGILGSIIELLFGIAVLVFLWGIVKFVAHADDEKAVAEGKSLIVWGLVGLFVLVTFWGIVGYIQESIGINDDPSVIDELWLQPTELPV
jgi:hypothetical protein